MSEEFYLKAFDGMKIHCKKNLPSNIQDIKGIVVIVHGFAEHLQRYEYLIKKLNDSNYVCYRFDNRGHGTSEGDTLDLKDYNDFLRDTDFVVQYAKKEYPNLPIFMLGHSMGGFITALYGEKYPNSLNGQILSGAATGEPIALNGFLKSILSIGNKICPTMRVKNDLSDIISRDKEVVNKYKNDPLIHDKATFRFYYQFMIAGISELQANMKDYKYDCFIIHGKDDKIISYKNAERFFYNISSKTKSIKIYDNLYHEIMNEPEKDTVINDIINWLDREIIDK